MPPRTIKKKIVKTTTPKTPTTNTAPKPANPPPTNPETVLSPTPAPEAAAAAATTTTPTPKTASPETTTTPEIAKAGESNTYPQKSSNSSGKIAVSRKTVVSKIATRKTTATPKSAPKIAAETNTEPETDTAVAPQAVSAAANAPDTAPEAISVAASAPAGTTASPATSFDAASEAPATEATPNLESASDAAIEASTVAGTNSIVDAVAAPNSGSADNASNATKPKTTIVVRKKIVKRKKVVRRPVGTAAQQQLPPKEEEKDESNPNPHQSEDNVIPDLNSPPSPVLPSSEASPKTDPVNYPLATEEQIHDTRMVENETEKGDLHQEVENESEKQNRNQAVENESVKGILSAAQDDEAIISERRRRRKTEVFVGGLDKDTKEDDLRKVFEKVGQIAEIRLMMNSQTGKNKGYAFLRYASAADAKRAVTELAKVEVCGKQCGVAAAEGNDTIFLGNIDKKWKKEDVIKSLQEMGIENIDIITVMADPNDPSRNRGFAFVELETNKDAQNAYKKLQKKNVFGKDRHITVSWAEPLNDPDEEEMQKVKSVYVDGISSSWDEDKVRKHFKKFGEIERVVLARNLQSAKRKDFAFVNYKTRDSALSCIEVLNKEGLVDEGDKLNVKVSLAKPVSKSKKGKAGLKSSNKDYTQEKPNPVRSEINLTVPSKGKNVGGVTGRTSNVGGDKISSTQELIQVLREQAAWKQGQSGLIKGSISYDYEDPMFRLPGGKRSYSSLVDDASYLEPRGYPRTRLDSSFPVASSSYAALSHGMSGTLSLSYQQRPGASHTAGSSYGTAERFTAFQMRHGSASYPGDVYPRY